MEPLRSQDLGIILNMLMLVSFFHSGFLGGGCLISCSKDITYRENNRCLGKLIEKILEENAQNSNKRKEEVE
jgi:hypothetical protein